jgi:hypothetical protein
MRFRLLAPLVCLLGLLPAEASAMQHAFLVQNSGWMEPFYLAPNSQFKPLVTAVIEAVSAAGDQISVLAFNQSTPGNPSPVVMFQGAPGPDARKAVQGIGLAHLSGKTLADTDFNEAVIKTITGPFKGAPGILWIFTNNKNSPGNNRQTALCNRKFYALVHSEKAITRSLAFPLGMPVAGPTYKANGMMIYALAYGDAADAHMRALLASGRLSAVLTQQPAQLKPLDRDAIRLVPKQVRNAPNTTAALGRDGRSLLLDVDVNSRVPVVQVVARMENMFFPYTIESAAVSAQIAGQGFSGDLAVAPADVPPLAPGEGAEISVAIPIGVTMPSPWSLSGFAQFGRSMKFPAVLRIRLDNQKLRVDGAFTKRLASLFPGDPLPEVFLPPAEIKHSVAEIPLTIRVNYPLYPLLIAMGLLLAVIGGGVFAFAQRGVPESYALLVDGEPSKVSVARLSSAQVISQGQTVAKLKRGFGKPTIQHVVDGHSVTFR